MKLASAASALLVALASSSARSSADAFSVAPTAFVPSRSSSRSVAAPRSSRLPNNNTPTRCRSSALSMGYSVGVVGATGAVGKEIVGCLEKSDLDVSSLRIFGSSRSAGSTRKTGWDKFAEVEVELFDVDKARECDVVFLAVSGDFALEHAEKIAEGDDGAVVIDNSSAFRYNPKVPLVVPEINAETTKTSKLIANPNCTTAIALMALWPLHKLFGLTKVIVSTYQAASGAGQPGMDELWDQTKAVVNGEKDVADHEIFAHPLPFNVIPHIDKFQENGYTKEEMKVTWETRKICGLPDDFPVSCTAVRIPTSRAHSESIVVETEKPIDLAAAREALAAAPGVKLVDDTTAEKYPMPLTATGQYDVEVGRLRRSEVFGDNGLEFFVSGDQLLRGAALNAVLVAEAMDKNGALKEKALA
uniref:aspartate-semialdehyde dehydrogenase n=1 Tax=Pseudictyota dubia TaxID=2749911 RepID=A0A7R9W0H0_9STRA|mmetsp:Transcript_28019/g.52167  ORF Transcript_28019/g.52167 Transcript_28019/m.52167 type:complete len:417 (+) Transcript_28019:218-1468(+)|eukprot:CAMPEP_0197457848 /NCGR_PEP_ID=MMETSP1175-20131217/47226_1 /TAXON_ID=1003142 /ORGANISM="Triceratium dubium, Strain CCMP147" /LENGTH=416 /DNA_ID=CAMNT_0042992327 /DNA_START=196 /DNA_END=1446 /DNA_ORIENTATION=+